MQSSPDFWRFLLPFRRKRKKLNRPGHDEPPSTQEIVEHAAKHERVPERGPAMSSKDRLKHAADRQSQRSQGS